MKLAMKPVVVLGKGPSACVIPRSDDYHIACLNESIRLVDSANYLFVNDWEASEFLTEEDILKADQVVVPTHMHKQCGKDLVHCSHSKVYRWSGSAHEYQLHTSQNPLGSDPKVPYFGVMFSVGETAVSWLMRLGYSEFILCGIDSVPGYSKVFDGGPQVPKPHSHYVKNFRRITERITRYGAAWTLWKDRS